VSTCAHPRAQVQRSAATPQQEHGSAYLPDQGLAGPQAPDRHAAPDLSPFRLHAPDPERLGQEGRGRQRQAGGPPDRDGKEDDGAGAREPRVAPGQRDPSQCQRIFCDGGARPPDEVMGGFIDAHRDAHGVERICKVLPIAPSTYYNHLAKRADPSWLSELPACHTPDFLSGSLACLLAGTALMGDQAEFRSCSRHA
jgi:hypothetical protein